MSMQVAEASLPAAAREQLVPAKRISLADVAHAGAAKPSRPAEPPAPSPSRAAATEPSERQQKPPPAAAQRTRSLQPPTPPAKSAGFAAASQQLPQRGAPAKPSVKYSGTCCVTTDARQPAENGHRKPLRAAGGAVPQPAMAAGGSRPVLTAVYQHQQVAAAGNRPSTAPSGPETAEPSDDRRAPDKQAAGAAARAVRGTPAPLASRSWWSLGLSKNAVTAI